MVRGHTLQKPRGMTIVWLHDMGVLMRTAMAIRDTLLYKAS